MIPIRLCSCEAQPWDFGGLAAVVLTLLPVRVVFLLLPRFLVEGIIEGALTG